MKKLILKSVTKSFSLGNARGNSILARIIDAISGKEKKICKVVIEDVSFEISAGEIVGIIGKNGSGKSTLLRLIAGIYTQDSGEIEVLDKGGKRDSQKDTILYINGFNHGLKARLTMRENIYAVGAIMGLDKKQIGRVFEDIVEFSGLAEFLDTKVYQFSTGMILRLNFSIFIYCISSKKLDILLLDEVFAAGGDIDFKQKAEEKMNVLLRSGVTVLLVSHSLQDIKRYTKRVIWIEGGVVKADSDTNSILLKYKID